jgi:hypothetical protein
VAPPTPLQLRALCEASKRLLDRDIDIYLGLKRSLQERPLGFEIGFRQNFLQFFKLNNAGLSEEFKDRYFALLFSLELHDDRDPYAPLLRELYEFERRKGDKALQASFVSKLVAIHDETRPLFDKYVQNFFGIGVPKSSDLEFRIDGFIQNLSAIRRHYLDWAGSPDFRKIVEDARIRHPLLERCGLVRIADFLVWTGGKANK